LPCLLRRFPAGDDGAGFGMTNGWNRVTRRSVSGSSKKLTTVKKCVYWSSASHEVKMRSVIFMFALHLLYTIATYFFDLKHVHLLQQRMFLLRLNAHTCLLLKTPLVVLHNLIWIFITFQIHMAHLDCTRLGVYMHHT
jgi:hypothetical protein